MNDQEELQDELEEHKVGQLVQCSQLPREAKVHLEVVDPFCSMQGYQAVSQSVIEEASSWSNRAKVSAQQSSRVPGQQAQAYFPYYLLLDTCFKGLYRNKVCMLPNVRKATGPIEFHCFRNGTGSWKMRSILLAESCSNNDIRTSLLNLWCCKWRLSITVGFIGRDSSV